MDDTRENSKGILVEFLEYLSKLVHKNTTVHRLSSMLLDHAIMTAIMVPPLILVTLTLGESEPFKSNPVETAAFYFMVLVYLNKDFVKGKSIAKRLMGLQVINRQNGQPANEIQCFLRNLTIPIWPLEVLVTLFSPKRRLGDIIANTRIEPGDKEKAVSIISDLKNKKISATTFLSIIIGIVYIGVLWYLMDGLI